MSAARFQSIRIEQAGSAISDLDRMTQANAALVEQTAAAATALKDQAQDMAIQASKFKLPIGR